MAAAAAATNCATRTGVLQSSLATEHKQNAAPDSGRVEGSLFMGKPVGTSTSGALDSGSVALPADYNGCSAVEDRKRGNGIKTSAVSQPMTTTEAKSAASGRSQLQDSPLPTKPTILVAEKLDKQGIELLKEHGNVDCSYNLTLKDLCAKVSLCDALIVRSGTKVTREVFEASRGRLKVVGRAGVGIDNVDLEAATEAGCLVVNAPTANTVAAAEHVIALMTSLARNVAQANASMKQGKWERAKYTGVSLVDKTLAIMGFGKVGSEVARRAKGLGMKVVAYDPYAAQDRARAIGVELVSFDEALQTGDFFSLNMPLTPSTAKIFNDSAFAKMKGGVRIINAARGGVIDDDALIRALDSGKVAQAGLDVFSEEPPPKDSPLLAREDIVVTPHLGASTIEAQEGVAIEIAEAVINGLQGTLSSTAVNAPMIPSDLIAELEPYTVLAQRLGRIAVSLVGGTKGIRDVTITYRTSRDGTDHDTRLLRAFVIKGLVEPIVSDTVVNIVNADVIAKRRGLRITEVRQSADGDDDVPVESILVQVNGSESKFASSLAEDGSISVLGRVESGIPHLMKVGQFSVDVVLEGGVIFCRQRDEPGMIGRVASLLGSGHVNVSFMSVTRHRPKELAIMAIGVDDVPTEELLAEISHIPHIEEMVYLNIN
ncbi:hypothetical protein CBR_g3076 [Chara braunii]|uniref:D-3-phosphoglycerate dehydrogenase n=1 Tax=Chara braunii TaxID=69332 RepID=A0A388KEP3_CHABU|nr:hypothetical protein CBR_g3076 [Chara braunii]|eukprot:GBG68532.1 hypothetical protein CBR_g3076 [Chara braunii]